MAYYANFVFSLPFLYFFIDSDFSICSSGRVKIVGALDFRIFKRGLAPDCTERPEWSAAERGLAVKAGRGRKHRASDDKNQKYR